MIREFLREAFRATLSLENRGPSGHRTSLRRLSKRIDPRQVNGGVFLGLNGTVVKSHGSADATGIASAIRLASIVWRESGFNERLGSTGCILQPKWAGCRIERPQKRPTAEQT